MALQALSKRAEIRTAFDAFKQALTEGIRPLRRTVGYQGGSSILKVYWLPKEQIWCALEPNLAENRYWCAFGLDDPRERDSLTITCEINSPHKGDNRRVAGAFLRDPSGALSVAHSGKIGGGRKGIGQTAFLSQCRCEEVPVALANGRTFDMLLVGTIHTRRFRAEVAHFVREVQRVKELIISGGAAPPANDKFTREFSGKKRAYTADAPVEALATHGLVVDRLAALLKARDPHNDRHREFYLGNGTAPTHLFEVKTDLTSTSIYAGVGQLMLHCASDGASTRRILVLPGHPPKPLLARLAAVQIQVHRYDWKGSEPVIRGIAQVLG